MSTLTAQELNALYQDERNELLNALISPLMLDEIDTITEKQIIEIMAKMDGINQFYQLVRAQIEHKKIEEIEVYELIEFYEQLKQNILTDLYIDVMTSARNLDEKRSIIMNRSGNLKGLKAFADSVKVYIQSKN